MTQPITAANDKFLGWRFKYRRRTGRWYAYICSQLSMKLEPPDFASKADARGWAKARAELLRVPFVEVQHRRVRRDNKPSESEVALNRVGNSDFRFRTAIKYGQSGEAVAALIQGANECLEAIALNPDQREHLIRCAAGRRRKAREVFDQWEKAAELSAPAPRLKIVRGSPA